MNGYLSSSNHLSSFSLVSTEERGRLGLFRFTNHSYRSWSDMASGSTLLAIRRISSQARQTLMKRRIPKTAPIRYSKAIKISVPNERLKYVISCNNKSPDDTEGSQYKHKPHKPKRSFGHSGTGIRLRLLDFVASNISQAELKIKKFSKKSIIKDSQRKYNKKCSIHND